MPSAPASRGQFLCQVVRNEPICREHYRLILRVDQGFPATAPGQFIQIFCREAGWLNEPSDSPAVDWSIGGASPPDDPDLLQHQAFLRRPFSLAGRRETDGGTELEIIHRVVGVGTHWLAELHPGQAVSILGPLGNRFHPPDVDHTALLIGGGVGIPPMLYLAEHLGQAGRRAVAFAGALTRDLLPLRMISNADASNPTPCIEEFARHGISSVISTDDGTFGYRGFVTQALEAFLDRQKEGRFTLYTCGPEPMMKRVASIAAERKLPVQIAVERAMACGMGTCQSCCIRVRSDAPHHLGWRYALACTDGPIFRGQDLLW